MVCVRPTFERERPNILERVIRGVIRQNGDLTERSQRGMPTSTAAMEAWQVRQEREEIACGAYAGCQECVVSPRRVREMVAESDREVGEITVSGELTGMAFRVAQRIQRADL